MKKILLYFPSIVFNVIETAIIFLVGSYINLSVYEIIVIAILFSIIRTILGGAMHYKDCHKCLIWTTFIFTSIFIVAKINLFVGIIITIFSAIVLTQKGNIDLAKN